MIEIAGNFVTGPTFDDPMSVKAKVRGDIDRLAWESRQLATDAASEGAAVMRAFAPGGEHSSGRLKENIGFDDAEYRPGGLGGGGNFEAAFGVRDFGEKYPIYLYEGTGVRVGRGNITSNNGNLMPIGGEGVSPKKTGAAYRGMQKGMHHQRNWVDWAREAAKDTIAAGIRTLGGS